MIILAPRDLVFQLTQDYPRRLNWDPFLREARLLGGVECPGIGVRSWCVTWFGVGMETEYVSYSVSKVAAVKMTRGPRIFQKFAASWNFDLLDEKRTEVSFRYSFELQRALRFLQPIVGYLLHFEMRRRLYSLKRVCEEA